MGRKTPISTWISIGLGFGLSLYALFVEYKAHLSTDYEALCDISERVSCSKVFQSDYGKIFSLMGLVEKDSAMDLPNAFYGLCFYIVCAVVQLFFGNSQFGNLSMLFLATSSLAMCAGLSYVLAVVLQDKCVVCFLTYLCNFTLFVNAAINS